MTKFEKNNTKNRKNYNISLNFNYDYYTYIFFEKNIGFYFQLKISNKLVAKLHILLIVY